MSSNFFIAIIIIIVANSSVLTVTSYLMHGNIVERTRRLWRLPLIDAILFLVLVVIWFSVLQPQNWLDIGAVCIYATVISFVASIEIPGYLLNHAYDDSIVCGLTELRSMLLRLKYSYDEFSAFKTKAQGLSLVLIQSGLNTLVFDFNKSCESTDNLDETIWKILLSELTSTIDSFFLRAKHPFPKLIDILSLAGMSFLLAQILRVI